MFSIELVEGRRPRYFSVFGKDLPDRCWERGWEPGKDGVSKPSGRPTIQLKGGEKPTAEIKE